MGSYEHCDPHGRGEIEQRRSSCRDVRGRVLSGTRTESRAGNTTPGTKHMEVQVSREGRKPVGTGGGTSPGIGEVERSRMPEPRVMHGAITELPRKPEPR